MRRLILNSPGMRPLWVEEHAVGSKVEATTVCFWSDPGNATGQMPPSAQFLYRICGPYNGKQTALKFSNQEKVVVVPPQHPGSYNWYMPHRNGNGVREVSVNWKAPAYSIIQPIQPGEKKKLTKCRPKRFLVASGAEYYSHHGKRDFVMRGTTVLPDETRLLLNSSVILQFVLESGAV